MGVHPRDLHLPALRRPAARHRQPRGAPVIARILEHLGRNAEPVGCCEGSSPMCYLAGEFRIGDSDTLLGETEGVPVYIGRAQGEAWAHTQLILDVVPGHGGMFSLDSGR